MASFDIYIRQYRPSDFPQVRYLLFEGLVTGGSVASVAKRHFLLKAPMISAYFLSICGAAILYYLPHYDNIAGVLGFMLLASGPAIWIANRRVIHNAFTGYVEYVLLEADMRDIEAHYAAPAAFFVAVRPVGGDDKDNEDKKTVEEVLGMVGLEYDPEKKMHTAEVRRMIISAAHRRRGLAALLMRALITHAESVRGLDAIELGTSEFQNGARRLYECLGWELEKTELEPSSFGNVMMWRLRREVETRKRK